MPCCWWLATSRLVADGLGEVAELGAFAEVDHRAAVQVDLDGGVAGVDGVLGRPGGLLGEADFGVGVAGLQFLEQVGDGDPVEVYPWPCSIRGADIRSAGRLLG